MNEEATTGSQYSDITRVLTNVKNKERYIHPLFRKDEKKTSEVKEQKDVKSRMSATEPN